MNKKKTLVTLEKIYSIAMITVLVAFCLGITHPEGASDIRVLRNRFIVSLMFLIPGFVFFRFKNAMRKIFYERDGLVFKDEASRLKAEENIRYMARAMLITGSTILALAGAFFILKV